MKKFWQSLRNKFMDEKTTPAVAPATSATTPAPVATPAAPVAAGPKPLISIDEFLKMELKMGKILTAEKIPGADKLYKLSVDMGGEIRTICSGVAQYYSTEELVGKVVPIIANLAPRVMRGVESKGMILMADGGSGPVLLTPIKEVAPGANVK